jgi:hypothetical protein
MERYEALPEALRRDMENRFMWAVHTGPMHPEATAEKAVETIVAPLLDHQRGAVDDRDEALALLRGMLNGPHDVGNHLARREQAQALLDRVRGR